jgi:hypothetical protein
MDMLHKLGLLTAERDVKKSDFAVKFDLSLNEFEKL